MCIMHITNTIVLNTDTFCYLLFIVHNAGDCNNYTSRMVIISVTSDLTSGNEDQAEITD